MVTQSSFVASRAPSLDRDVLLLVSTEPSPSHGELAHRLAAVADARPFRLGPASAAELASIQTERPRRVVAVPLTLSASDPMLGELAGPLRWAKARRSAAAILRGEPLGAVEHVVGWASRRAREALARWSEPGPTGGTALLVLAGGGPPAVNAEACALARLVGENLDLELADAAFVRDARPSAAEGIDRLFRLGAERIIALPLAPLDDSIYQAARGQVEGVPNVALAEPLLAPGAAAAVARRRYEEAVERWERWGDDGLSPDHGHDHAVDPLQAGDDILPPRYRGGGPVNSKSMGTASLIHDAEGRVAWDRVWRSFCNLALAGGPPHRGSLLEPPTRDESLADPAGSARAAAEIARGLAMITGLPILKDAAPGWVGLVCPDEEMAIWMLRAIVVENVSVRREVATLFLPAGPAYRVEKEIKNVITAVAKTHHYWTEHRAARQPTEG